MSPDANIVLTGFMGTGKSAVGRLVARRLGRVFVDMDARIEQRAGCPIARIFAEQGEPAFRALERGMVQELAAARGQVIATGGGVVLNPDNLADFSRTGLLVCLTADPATILERVRHDTGRPLLQQGDKEQRIVELLAARRAAYAAIPRQVDTVGLTVEQVAERVLALFAAAH